MKRPNTFPLKSPLEIWMQDNNCPAPLLAGLIGCQRSTIHRMNAGKSRLDLETGLALERVTGGAVTYLSMIEFHYLKNKPNTT